MKKIFFSLLSLSVLLILGGCQSKFDPQTASKESREVLITFLDSYEDQEQLSKKYNNKALENFFTDENKNYFTENFKENILPKKLEKLTYNPEEDWRTVESELLFFNVLGDREGIKWEATEPLEDSIDKEKESVTFFVKSISPAGSGGDVEMVKENGKWKINNILDI